MAPPSPKPNNASDNMLLVLRNSDLLRQILLQLPAESLVKLQSVCKEWLSLIFSDEFRQQHTIHRLKLQHQSLILQTGAHSWWIHLNSTNRRLTSFSLSVLHDEVKHFILQSSNGLLLLKPDHCLDDKNNYFLVHNPATKQSQKIIPPPSTTHPRVADVSLAFDPSKSPYYELVYIRSSPDRGEAVTHRIEVYSSKSHNWKELTLERSTLPTFMWRYFAYFFGNIARARAYWNNAIYWRSERGPYYCCLDIAKREMKTLPYPPARPRHAGIYKKYEEFGQKKVYYHLQESNGRLYHVELNAEGGCETVTMWELELSGDDHHWLLRKHHVLPEDPPPPQLGEWERPRILTFLVDTCSLLICWGGMMRVYSLENGSYEDFLDETGQPFSQRWCCFNCFQFGATFAFV